MDHGKQTAGRAPFVMSSLNDRTYAIVDELVKVAKAHDSTAARGPSFMYPGLRVNRIQAAPSPMVPKDDSERY